MAEERNLGLARAREMSDEDPSKAALQRRMEEARDSITNTVTEIKDNVAQQYENVKDALDWREHFKRQPVAWTIGAAGVGFFVGYGIAAALSGDDDEEIPHASQTMRAYAAKPVVGEPLANAMSSSKTNGKDDGPGLIDRFKETSAYERLSKEAGSLGDRLIEELSSTAQQVVLPALLKKIKGWIGVDLSDKTKTTSMASEQRPRGAYEPSLAQSREL
jgi:hypothetical protein